MVFSEAAYKEVFPDPVFTPAPGQDTNESMLPDETDKADEHTADDGIEVETPEPEEGVEDDTGTGDTGS